MINYRIIADFQTDSRLETKLIYDLLDEQWSQTAAFDEGDRLFIIKVEEREPHDKTLQFYGEKE